MLPTALYIEPRGEISTHVRAHYKATPVISPMWVRLINLVYVVAAITDGDRPHMSLISHVGPKDTCGNSIRWHWSTRQRNQHWGRKTDINTQTLTCTHTDEHWPLCCCSPRWESSRNASSGTDPAQTVVSCPAKRKIPITVQLFIYLFIYLSPIWPFAEDLADLRSGSTYLHEMINFSPSAGEPELISLFTVNWLIAWEQNNVHSGKGFN